MATPDKATCEVRIDGAWQLMPLTDPYAHDRAADKRCPACHGPRHTQGSCAALGTVAMVHRRTHDGGPSLPRSSAGEPKRIRRHWTETD